MPAFHYQARFQGPEFIKLLLFLHSPTEQTLYLPIDFLATAVRYDESILPLGTQTVISKTRLMSGFIIDLLVHT